MVPWSDTFSTPAHKEGNTLLAFLLCQQSINTRRSHLSMGALLAGPLKVGGHVVVGVGSRIPLLTQNRQGL